MPTLADVAAHAGVSTATVSKVLSNTPYVSEDTRARVMASVEAVGYVPNLAARALSTGKTNIIAMVFPRVIDAVFTDPLVQHILEGVEAACIETGYNLLLSTPYLSEAGPDERYLQLLDSRYVDGIVALDNVPTASVVQTALDKDIPAVSIGYGPSPHFVRSDDHQGANRLMEHLLNLGHRAIGVIAVNPSLNYAIQPRLDGFASASEACGIDFAHFPLCEGDFSITSGARCANQLLSEHPHLTALLCINDRMALGAMQFVRGSGLQVPEDISIVGYDDVPLAQLVEPALTTVNQQAPTLGRHAVNMLLRLMQRQHVESEIIPTQLIIRQSTTSAKTS